MRSEIRGLITRYGMHARFLYYYQLFRPAKSLALMLAGVK
mgnify:FL=1|jgi:hypothetical protein